jgi:hypothetical protein
MNNAVEIADNNPGCELTFIRFLLNSLRFQEIESYPKETLLI